MGSFQQQLIDRIPAPLKKVLEGSSRKELISSINTTLMVFNAELIHGESGAVSTLADSKPETIAQAAKKLIPDSGDDVSVLLLLPPSEFIATSHSLPGISKENLISALRLQTETILPSYEEDLSLAIDANSSDGNAESVALWLPQEKLNELFDAFSDQNLFLAAIKPRILNSEIGESVIGLLDTDESDVSFVLIENGLLRAWQQVNKIDLEQEEFVRQWQDSLENSSATSVKDLSSYQQFLPALDNTANSEYNFFPTGALNARKKVEKGRKLLAGLAGVAVLLLLSAIPFIQQSLAYRSAAATLESSRLMSADARQDQQIVVNFENEWGPLSDFPEQRIREAMFTLQNVLSPEQLTSLEISEGLISIQGTSTDPQAILQRLEQDPLFTEVLFSRATNNTRYYIDLRLSPVNFEAYMIRYFPDD
ncbi:MAG: hypothetical protein OXU66_04060 [Gammaproteobacteria bacterium]|nr:hypothetical protein [Gammaproteobacteria bacterium]